MFHPRTPSRRARIAVLLTAALLATIVVRAAAGSPDPPVPPPSPSPAPVHVSGGGGDNPDPSNPSSDGTTVSGQVTVAATGAPYPNATVEFKDVYGGNVHTETGADGSYSVTLPAGVYTALALDLANTNANFDVAGGGGNTVEVPPSTTVDFTASPIN